MKKENYTSNLVKLTKHLDKLQNIQQGKPSSPVMMHLSLTNNCNLNCDYCCYGNRTPGIELSKEQALSAVEQFSKLGTKGLELTGGGEPTMHPDIVEIVKESKRMGMDVGLITNGIYRNGLTGMYKNLQWMRISLHGIGNARLEEKMGNTIKIARDQNPDITLSSVIIGKDVNLERVVDFTNKYQLPTRVTPDLTSLTIDEDMQELGDKLSQMDSKYLFLSDFNVDTNRYHNRCYAHLIKPFVFTDGNVYSCPSIGLSPDNSKSLPDKFKVCSIDDITEVYSLPSNHKELDCTFCKYSQFNHFVDDLKRDVKHKNFA